MTTTVDADRINRLLADVEGPNGLNARTAVVESKVDGLDSKVDGLDGKLDQVIAAVGSLRSDMTSAHKQIEEANSLAVLLTPRNIAIVVGTIISLLGVGTVGGGVMVGASGQEQHHEVPQQAAPPAQAP